MSAKSIYSYTVKREKAGTLHEDTGPLCTPDAAAAFLRAIGLHDLEQEHFVTLLLDTKHKVKGYAPVTVGLVDQCPVHSREVFRTAILLGASQVMLGHNHPSGDPTPSKEDIEMTKAMVGAGRIIGIDVLDHIVLGGQRHSSLRAMGHMG